MQDNMHGEVINDLGYSGVDVRHDERGCRMSVIYVVPYFNDVIVTSMVRDKGVLIGFLGTVGESGIVDRNTRLKSCDNTCINTRSTMAARSLVMGGA